VVSIVIPNKNDTAAVARLLGQLPAADPAMEVIVCSTGASDAAFDALRRARPDVHWLEEQPGRARQLNAGAARATGEWLWFVHADSTLPEGWRQMFRSLTDARVVGGSFAFALDAPAWQARVIERGVAFRVRWFALPYGDQGLFVRRTVFEQLGGFAAIPLMEDVDFVRRLRRRGPLRHLDLKLVTSARRWQRDGWFRRSAGNLMILGMYLLGVSPERLARRYDLENAEGPRQGNADQKTR
jgi:rSAM/selenodomain-associated transferase 2